MPVFICKLGTPDGNLQTRELEASDEAQLRAGLASQGYQVFSVKRNAGSLWARGNRFMQRIKNDDLISLNQELIVLFKAGMPIVPLLDAILENRSAAGSTLVRILEQVREDVTGGMALSTALERHEGYFPTLYLASIRAGERTGDLPGIILRYTLYLKRNDALRKKLISSLVYPGILICVAILAITLLLVYVVPTFSQVYADSGSQLPLTTQTLISFSRFLQDTAILWIPGIAAGIFALRYWSRTPDGKAQFDKLKLRLPLINQIVFSYAVAGFSRTLATLLGSGIPLVESLRMSTATLNSQPLEQGMLAVIKQVEEGGKLVAALERYHLMPPLALRMLGVGESSGSLEEMLTAVAEHLEEQIEEKMRLLSTAVEPAVMLFMGGVIGFIIVAMYLPIFQLAGTVGS